jgi:hypothetical protein
MFMGLRRSSLLQAASDAPVFLVDLVDVDPEDDTAWSGIAARRRSRWPIRTRCPGHDPHQPQDAALVRVSAEARPCDLCPAEPGPGRQSLIAPGEMLKRDMAFTGTSGVVTFERPAGEVLARVIDSGLEHHMALAYGDHVGALESFAAAAGLPVAHPRIFQTNIRGDCA